MAGLSSVSTWQDLDLSDTDATNPDPRNSALVLSFFDLLWLKPGEGVEEGSGEGRGGFYIPDTIIYEGEDGARLRPVAWYFSRDDRPGVLRRRQSKCRDTELIQEVFGDRHPHMRSSDVVAR